MRPVIDYRSASNTNYKRFCKEHPEVRITFAEWKTIIYSFNRSMRDHILETGEKIRFPGGLGDFSIYKWKPNKVIQLNGETKVSLPINWAETNKSNKIVYFMNYHSEGYQFRWWWFKSSAMFKFARMWTFKPSRVSMTLLGKHIMDGIEYQHKYRQWENKH